MDSSQYLHTSEIHILSFLKDTRLLCFDYKQ